MDKQVVFQRIKSLGLLAVIRGPSEQLTLKAVDALVEGGVLGIEVTFSTPNAPAVVGQLGYKFGFEFFIVIVFM